MSEPIVAVANLPVALIDIAGNPRTEPTGLEELADSIRQQGVIAPILVRASGDRFRLVYGQRRLLASRLAGRDTIPAIVTDEPPELDLAKAIVENIQRQDLNPIDEARAIQQMVATGARSVDVARLLGRSESHVSNRLRLLGTDEYVVEAISTGLLSAGHGIILAALPLRQQRPLAKRAAIEQWSQSKLASIIGPRQDQSNRGERRTAVIPAEKEEKDATAARYERALFRWTTKVDLRLARVLLWALVEMDVLIEGRFIKRHPTNRPGVDKAWPVINDLAAYQVAAELARVLSEVVAEYGPVGVKASIPTVAA